VAPSINPHLMTMRTKRAFRLPTDRLTLSATSASTLSLVPSSVCAALIDPNLRHTIEEEFVALITNNTRDLVPRPVGSSVVTGKWIFKHKFNSDGSLERYKACGSFAASPSDPASTMVRPLARWSSQP
jgi:hypothetical protein